MDNLHMKLLIWTFKRLMSNETMLHEQKALCKECQTKLEGTIYRVKPANSTAVLAELYGLFCSENCEIKYTVARRQELEAKSGRRVIVSVK